MSRLTWVGSIALVLLAAAPALRSQNCSVWNTTFSPQSNSGIDWTQHGTGDHTGSAAFSGSCSYSGSVAGSPCQVYCQSTYTAAANDSGLITNPFKYHVANYGGVTGQATSNGPQVSCGAEVAVAAHSCIVLLGCDLTVTISGSVDGIGGSVGYSASTIWSPAVWKYQNTCAAEKAPYPSCLGNCSVNCVPPNCGPYDA